MTVNPGFGGQKFIRSTLSKVAEIARMIRVTNPGCHLEVDGGVDEKTAVDLAEAGATMFVAGHSVFSKSNIPHAIRSLRKAAENI